MKTFPGLFRSSGCQITRRGVFWLALVLGAAICAAGCGKGKSTGPTTGPTSSLQTTQNLSQPTAPGSDVNAQPAPVALATNVAAAPNAAPDLTALNQALRGWLMRNRRVPANFEEFAATAGVTIPPPPAGKKYAITKRMEVVLVDR